MTIIVPGGCGSGIQVAPNPVRVGASERGTSMVWVIRSSKGWKFATKAKGIDFGKASAFVGGTAGETKEKDPVPTYTLSNNHITGKAAPGTFKYDINLTAPDGSDCQVDPTVINQ